MSLEKIFKEKIENENSKDLSFVKHDYLIEEILKFIEKELGKNTLDFNGVTKRTKDFIKNYGITPMDISKLVCIANDFQQVKKMRYFLGTIFSAIIQECYEQGNRFFKFENLEIPDFGNCLKCSENEKIEIVVGRANADNLFSEAQNISISCEILDTGAWLFLHRAKNCYAEINKAKGYFLFCGADGCRAKVIELDEEKYPLYNSINCSLYIEKSGIKLETTYLGFLERSKRK